MYEVKIQGIKYDLPSSIDDVSIGRFIALRQIDPNDVLSIIHWAINSKPMFVDTNTIADELGNVFALIRPVLDEVYAFMNNKAKREMPETVEVLGEILKIKGGLLNEMPYWAYVVTKSIVIKNIGNETFDPTDDIPRVLAHYLYNYSTKRSYNEADADGFIDVVNDIPMKQAIQLGNFFLSKHQSLWQRSKRRSKLTLTRST